MTARILRGVALAIACLGVADPTVEVQSSERPALAVEIVDTPSMALPADGGGTRLDRARRVLRTLSDRLGSEFAVVDGPVSTAAAVVVVADGPPDREEGRWRPPGSAIPVHVVNVSSLLTPNVRIVRAGSPRRMTIWDSAAIIAEVEGRGLTGQEVVVRLLKAGVELASVRHRWRSDAETFEARLTFVPPAGGAHVLEIRASSAAPERTDLDNRVSLLVEADDVRRRVLVYQPRLSWMATFVARALERDPRIELSTRARASRGIEITAGTDRDEYAEFGAVVVGAPDALTRAEVDALTRYVTRRGGSVLLLADRKPTGPSLALSPAESFDEILLENAADLGAGLRASELSVPRRSRPGWEPLAADGDRVVVLTIPRERGHLVFSGALDAWRYREGSRYWQDLVAAFAARTPPPLDLQVEPAVVRPGALVEVTSGATSARVGEDVIRLWPGGEPDSFRGVFRAPGVTGRVTVTAGQSGPAARAVVAVERDAAQPWVDRDAGLEAFAVSHGGRLVAATELEPLISAIRQTASSRSVRRVVRPMRSAWWMVPFATLLAAEWTLRRRRHLH